MYNSEDWGETKVLEPHSLRATVHCPQPYPWPCANRPHSYVKRADPPPPNSLTTTIPIFSNCMLKKFHTIARSDCRQPEQQCNLLPPLLHRFTLALLKIERLAIYAPYVIRIHGDVCWWPHTDPPTILRLRRQYCIYINVMRNCMYAKIWRMMMH